MDSNQWSAQLFSQGYFSVLFIGFNLKIIATPEKKKGKAATGAEIL